MPTTQRQFPEVIIVGAGSGGILMGLLLDRMGAPFTILERATKIKPIGAAFTLQGNILAAIDQLGFLDEVKEIALPIPEVRIYNKNLEENYSVAWKEREQVTGYGYYACSRYRFHDIMFQKVPSHRIQLNKNVVRYEEVNDRVIIYCSDGSRREGDILIGADGVHSCIRNLMYKQLSDLNMLPESDTKGNKVHYVMTVALFEPKDPSRYPQLQDPFSNYSVVHGGNYKHWFVFTLANNHMCWAIVKQISSLEEAKKMDPMIADRSSKGAQAMMNEFRNFPSSIGGVLGDMFDETPKENISKVFLEEGCHETWHHERVVLIGDAIHKVNPETGQGSMNAMQDAIILSNCIYDMYDTTSKSVLNAFQEYKTQRFDQAKARVKDSSTIAALSQGQTLLQRISRYIHFKIIPYSFKCQVYEEIESYRPQVNWLPMVKPKGTKATKPQVISKRYRNERNK